MMFLKQNDRQFEFSRFSRLRDPIEYAEAKFMSFIRNKTNLADGMLKFSSKPIHISLIEMTDVKESKTAVKMFKNVLGYMGDRKYANPPQLATDILNTCINGSDDIRIEIFVQIMKQLNQNPEQTSMRKGHELMALCLNTFRPPDRVENFVAVYLIQKFPNSGQQWLSEMHRAQYEGGSQQPMSSETIPAWTNQFMASTKRSRYSMADTGAMVSVKSFRTRTGGSANGETKTSASSSRGAAPSTPDRSSIRKSDNTTFSGVGEEPTVCRAVAIHTYTDAEEDDDGSALTFKKGQEMDILEISDDWWRARMNGVEGWVPEQYIKRL
tara:strand:+ start:202 stop:1176 length:975 start_codon:yes stop_codon:yes gene_type:complete